MATVTVLGCGTSTGVPMPGCSCPVCTSSHPRNNRQRTSISIRFGGSVVLFDTTPDLRLQALAHGITRIEQILFTHAHADHIMGFDDVRSFSAFRKTPIPVYASAETFRELRRIFTYVFEGNPSYEGGLLPKVSPHQIENFQPIPLPEGEAIPFPLLHGKMTVLGFRIGDFGYATDCKEIPPESFQVLKGVKVLILDALRNEPHPTHFTIPEAIEVAQRIGAEKTYFTHLSHTVDYESANAALPEGIELCYDGLTFEI